MLALLALASGGVAQAQSGNSRLPPGAVVQPLDEGPGAELRRNLTTLANNPRSLEALIGAGRAAVAQGDGEAALSFFARADEVDGRNARVKAGMASALVLLERGSDALAMFREAEALGAPVLEIARDRGLAYDLTGDPQRAQQDYELVLRRRDDPEVRRRMALSLAISGRRDEALAMLSGQLRNHDRAAWRTQAFVLALTGDPRGASETASRMMPGAGEQMAPFFARLAGLGAAQKARAVHFGTFPRDGRAVAVANVDSSAVPPARQLPRPATPAPESIERGRPGSDSGSGRYRIEPGPRPDRYSSASEPIAPAVQQQTSAPVQRRFEVEPTPARPEPAAPVRISEAGDIAPGFSLPPGSAPPSAEAGPASGVAQPSSEPAASEASRLADLTSVIAALPRDEARAAPAQPARTAARAPARRPAPQPARRWVQIATVAERAALSGEFARLRSRAPDALRNRTAFAAPYGRSSSRLLVGPFETGAQAQALVNQLGSDGVEAFAWTSEAGQEIERVQTSNASRAAPSRAQTQQRQSARGSNARATGNSRPTTTARPSRGRSEPEPRTPPRRRRAN